MTGARRCLLGAICFLGCHGVLDIEERSLATCEPGVTRCGESDREVCDNEGRGFIADPCPEGAPLCALGACRACVTGEQRCGASGRELCDETGVFVADPCPGAAALCEDGACTCPIGESRCFDGARETCDPSARTFLPDPCPLSAPQCNAGGVCTACEAGSSWCDPSGLRSVCRADGSGWEVLGCAQDDTCIAELVQGSAEGFGCVRTGCGAIYCWGRNDKGQLAGQSSEPFSPEPVRIPLGATARDASTGLAHACAVLEGGDVVCWGQNDLGQASGFASEDPVPITTIALSSGALKIDSGPHHSCAVLSDGRAQCWGEATDFKLGWDNTSSAPEPVPDNPAGDPLTGVADLALSQWSSCALMLDKQVRCWGRVGFQPVLLYQGHASVPVATGVEGVDGGWLHHVLLTEVGLLVGGRSSCGQTGAFETELFGFLPISLPGATQVSGGQLHSCALVGTTVACWGANALGQVGIGAGCQALTMDNYDVNEPQCGAIPILAPVTVDGLPGPAVDVAAYFSHSCALIVGERELEPHCWGEATSGELGNTALPCSNSPLPIPWPPGSTP